MISSEISCNHHKKRKEQNKLGRNRGKQPTRNECVAQARSSRGQTGTRETKIEHISSLAGWARKHKKQLAGGAGEDGQKHVIFHVDSDWG